VSWFFLFFFVSGCCGLIYEIVWLRLAMAQYGVTTALTSIVLSAFMAGLGLGSWAAGRLVPKYGNKISFPPLRLYALTELLIGISAILVPMEFELGRRMLERFPHTSSLSYYVTCGVWIAFTLVPWCALMGATIPVAMFAIRRSFEQESSRSFSFLYLANVLGAVAGTIAPLILVELYGFHGTLRFAAGLNVLLALSATGLTLGRGARKPVAASVSPFAAPTSRKSSNSRLPLFLLFSTGLTSMAIEVVWIRQFTPYLGTVVYAFAFILGSYLAATFLGSRIYRMRCQTGATESRLIWILLGFSILLPLITADPGLHVGPLPVGEWLSRLTHVPLRRQASKLSMLRLVLGICPFSAILGFVTPMLIDRWSGGDPDRAGRAYAVNVVGCILGPLLSGFVLLPFIDERWALFLFAIPWLVIGMLPRWSSNGETLTAQTGRHTGTPYVLAFVALLLIFTSRGYETAFTPRAVLRDSTATTIASGVGMAKRLRVNGIGMTALDPVTKIMAHLSLSSLDHSPSSALVVCFGMGTTYRSLLSWSIPTTAVELVPSVPRLFSYYHADAAQLLQSPLSHVVIDDGRRFLERTSGQYDVINLDPPPPVEAAGSSLLYSNEFYAAAKKRLRPDGILEQWLPEDETTGDPIVPASVALALSKSFVHVRVFRRIMKESDTELGRPQGLLFLGSDSPIGFQNPASLVRHMPSPAIRDLLEWAPAETTAENELAQIVNNEVPIATILSRDPEAVALDDDRPVNEYYMLRHLRSSKTLRQIAQLLGLASPTSSPQADASQH
jgi:spermidine synthase